MVNYADEYGSKALLLADNTLSYSNTTAGQYIKTTYENFVYEVAASGVSDQHETTAGGLKLYWRPQFIESPKSGVSTVALDIRHYSKQGFLSPVMIAGHDYTDAARAVQIDKVGGDIAAGSYVMGLRRGSNHIRRNDKDGTYVPDCGFLRCSYDIFTETAAFTASISGNTLTVTAVSSGALVAGNFVLWSGTDNGTTITAQLTGATGGAGTYSLAVRGDASASQTIISQAMTAKVKSEVLGFYIGKTGNMGWAVDRAQFSSGYSGSLYAYTFNASSQIGPIAQFNSSTGPVLNIFSNGVRSLAPLAPGLYNVGGLPAASSYTGYIAYVTNGNAGAPCLAVSNGTSWLRIALGASVSAT